MHVMVVCIYLFSMVATLNFNCDNILVASYIKFVIIEFDNFRYSFTYVMNLIPIKRFFAIYSYEPSLFGSERSPRNSNVMCHSVSAITL